MPNKKAQASPVFKYILALVAGVLFISFFIGFAMQHKGQQTTLETGRIVFGFDDLLTLFSTSSDSSMVYPEQGFPSAVNLNIIGDKISSGTISKTTSKIVFSPTQMTAKQFYIWTKRWKQPFTIDNFYYITDGRVATYVIYDQDTKEIAEELTDKYQGFPKTFNVDKYEISRLDSKTISALRAKAAQYRKIRFVVLSSKLPDVKPFANADTLIVKPLETDWSYGTVKFKDGETDYLGKEMLVGAIMAEDKKSYDAAQEKALDKLSIMSQLYQKKAQILEKACPGEYMLITQALKTLSTDTAPERFSQKAQALKELNRQFQGGCPDVF